MTKFFYRSIFAFILIIPIIFMFACENATRLECASFSEITSAGSENYAVRVNFASDSRIKEKYLDIQIKTDKICQLTFWEENDEKLTLNFPDFDEWYSLTTLIAEAKGLQGEEEFEKYSEATGKTYLFNYDGELKITMRAVVGDIEDNSSGTGKILVGSEPISSQFNLKIKA